MTAVLRPTVYFSALGVASILQRLALDGPFLIPNILAVL
jgi:hypothetical protein